ncbi:hypothetical protein AAVH_05243, partial [Aphelenchoides avenae]
MRCALLLTVCAVVGITPSHSERSESFNCTGKPDGLYAVGCSSVFWICTQQSTAHSACPAHLRFNPHSKDCDYAWNIDVCGGRSSQQQSPSPSTTVPLSSLYSSAECSESNENEPYADLPDSSLESAQPRQAPSFVGPAEQQLPPSADEQEPVYAPLFKPSSVTNLHEEQSQQQPYAVETADSSLETAQPRQAPSFVGPAEQRPAYSTDDESLEQDNPFMAPSLTQGPPRQGEPQPAKSPVPVQDTPVPAVPWIPSQPHLAPFVAADDVHQSPAAEYQSVSVPDRNYAPYSDAPMPAPYVAPSWQASTETSSPEEHPIYAPLIPSSVANMHDEQSQRPAYAVETSDFSIANDKPRQAPSFVAAAGQQTASMTVEESFENPFVAPALTQGPPSPADKAQLMKQAAQLPVQVQDTPVPAVPWSPSQPRSAYQPSSNSDVPMPAPYAAPSRQDPTETSSPAEQPVYAPLYSSSSVTNIRAEQFQRPPYAVETADSSLETAQPRQAPSFVAAAGPPTASMTDEESLEHDNPFVAPSLTATQATKAGAIEQSAKSSVPVQAPYIAADDVYQSPSAAYQLASGSENNSAQYSDVAVPAPYAAPSWQASTDSSLGSAQPRQAPSFVGPAEHKPAYATVEDGLEQPNLPEPPLESTQPRQAPVLIVPAEQQLTSASVDNGLAQDKPLVAPTLTQGPPSQTPKAQVIDRSAQSPVQVQETTVPAVPWTPNGPRAAAPQNTSAPSKTAPARQHEQYDVWSSPDYHDIYQSPPASVGGTKQPGSVAQVKSGRERILVKKMTVMSNLAPYGTFDDTNQPPAAVYQRDSVPEHKP